MGSFSVVSGLGWPSADEDKDSDASGADDRETRRQPPDTRRSAPASASSGGPERVVAGLGWPIG
jgi:hypothetical protein